MPMRDSYTQKVITPKMIKRSRVQTAEQRRREVAEMERNSRFVDAKLEVAEARYAASPHAKAVAERALGESLLRRLQTWS